ncbi:MAG: hypothetical protein LBC97_00445 [Bifidobacteriaceae bacterium]|jgi:UDPglucose 6-dehydrogenase|nr:hypothetical protein [Bifidobacteriaceae bacterium]
MNEKDGSPPDHVAELFVEFMGGTVQDYNVAVLGPASALAPNGIGTSPAVMVASALALHPEGGAFVRAVVPQGAESHGSAHPELECVPTVEQAVEEADVVLLAAAERGWDRRLDPNQLSKWTSTRTIVDAYGVLDAELWSAAGWKVHNLSLPQG